MTESEGAIRARARPRTALADAWHAGRRAEDPVCADLRSGDEESAELASFAPDFAGANVGASVGSGVTCVNAIVHGSRQM